MVMIIILFTSAMLCYALKLVTNPYMIYEKDNKMGF
jgi:hypothetical protein